MTLVMTTPIITGAFLLLYFPEKIIIFNKDLNKLTIKSEALLRKENYEYAISDIRQVTLALEGVERHKIDLFNKNLNDLISQKEHEYPMKDTQKITFDTDKFLKNQSYSILLTLDSKNQSIRLFSLKSPDAEKVVSLICEFLNIT